MRLKARYASLCLRMLRYQQAHAAASGAEVQRLVGTPFVVMGHSHEPEVTRVGGGEEGGGGTYINIGSWLHPSHPKPHPEAECDCSLTHVLLRPQAGSRP